MTALLREVFRRDALLAWAGAFNLMLFVGMLLVAPFDTRIVTGLNPWIKPMKFALSIALYLWTVAWYLGETSRQGPLRSIVRWGIVVAMLTEIVCIAMQAARGTTSHYNDATVFDERVFQMMGLMIVVNTELAGALLWLLRGQWPAGRSAYAWGLRLGLVVFIIGSLEAMAMILRGAHTVGLPDGGPGLPFINWSTQAGDLRVAHFLGLQALQGLPLAGLFIDRIMAARSTGFRVQAVTLVAATWLVVMLALFLQALRAAPLVAL